MRHLRIVTFVTLLFAVVMLGASTHSSQAQEATPTPEIITRTFETLGIVNDLSLAPELTLQLERYTWLPGVVTEMHTHPGEIDIMYVQSGEIAWSVENGEGQITRATMDGAPGPSETLMPGAEVTLYAGDAVVFDYTSGLLHQGRVVGDAPAVMLVAYVYDPTKQS